MAELPQASSSFLLIGSSIARLNFPAASLSQPSWQLQHLWGNGYRLSFTDKALTAIQATDTAIYLLNPKV
jgi:hypothetical protein